MRHSWTALAALATVVAAVSAHATSAHATAVKQYGKNEYLVIEDGFAPNKQFSIASHGEGEDGNDNFHLYLMAEPSHRKVVPLESINGDNILDTAPEGFRGRWSADSRHVAIHFRFGRHDATMLLYEIRKGRPHQVGGPEPFSVAGKGLKLDADDHQALTSIIELTWLTPTTFSLKEHRLFRAKTPDLARRLGTFAKEKEETDRTDGAKRYLVDFSVEAVGELIGGDKYRLDKLKPGAFD